MKIHIHVAMGAFVVIWADWPSGMSMSLLSCSLPLLGDQHECYLSGQGVPSPADRIDHPQGSSLPFLIQFSFSNLETELHHFSTTNQNSTGFSADWNASAPILSYQLTISDYLIQSNHRPKHAKHLHTSNVDLSLGLLHSKKIFFTCAAPLA